MELSYLSLIVFPLFVTPALLMFVVYKFAVPKSKAISGNNFFIFLVFIFISGAFNLNRISNYLQLLWVDVRDELSHSNNELFDYVLGTKDISTLPVKQYQNAFELINDIHFQTLLIAIFIWLGSFLIYRFDRHF